MTRVLIADDSPIFADVLAEVLGEEGDLTIVGIAVDGPTAVAMAGSLRPDVIVMDVVMPHLDGLEAVSRIMASHPTPTLMMTGDPRGRSAELGFEALRRGAVDLVLKPAPWPFATEERRWLRERVRAAAGLAPPAQRPQARRPLPPSLPRTLPVSIVAIAASTGGPAALAAVLRALPATFPAGIAVVQHLSPGFAEGLARWLAASCPLRVAVAKEGDLCAPGAVLLAPDHLHLTLDRDARAHLSPHPDDPPHRPSADVLFESVARALGPRAAGVVLTGMGTDGARGLADMRRAGALTLAQDEATSVVYGMPRAALTSGAAEHAVPLDRVAESLARAALPQGSRPP